MKGRGWLAAALALCLGCADDQTDGETVEAAASASGSARPAVSDGLVLPPPRPFDSDPLDLGPLPADVVEGQRVFAVPAEMLETAEVGKALALEAATVLGRDGDDVVVRVGHGKSYPVNPHYLVVPRPGRFRRGAELIASYRGRMRHAVAKLLSRDKWVVQFTDLGFSLADQKLDPEVIGVLGEGLVPGAFAVRRAAGEYRHVTLISAAGERWLVIGEDGISALVPADELTRLPRPRFAPKVGQEVLAAWRGSMVRAEVRALERPGLYTVKRPRAGAPLWVGPGQIMPVE